MNSPAAKSRLNWILAAALLSVVTAGVCVWAGRSAVRTGAELPVLGMIADFEMTDQAGRAVRRADLAGRVWIADFIFTRCAGQCPLLVAKMKKLHNDLPDAHFASITSDPAYDTPEVLARYAEARGAASARWHFLTGPMEEANRVSRSFLAGDISEPSAHSLRFVLIDTEGKIRGSYDSQDGKRLEDLRNDARRLIRRR